ncbi:MAG: hypothetical protein E7332_03315 [Clostridiales bacterium]|nr:hypothetical protein [Clostridiales bacterium]
MQSKKRSILYYGTGFLSGLLAVGIILSVLFFAPKKEEGKGYDSAEDALFAYLTALKSLDYDEALSTFAIETALEEMDLREAIELNGAYINASGTNHLLDMYATDAFSEKIMLQARTRMLCRSMIAPFYRVCMDLYQDFDPYNWQSWVRSVESEEYEAFDMAHIHGRDTEKIISEIEIGEIYRWEEIPYSFEEWEPYMEGMFETRQRALQVDDQTVTAAEVRIDGEDYLLMMYSVCYGKKWYNYFEHPINTYYGENGGLIRADELILK